MNAQVKCDEILLLMFIPGIDSIRVSLQRVYKGQSPLVADNTHLHHLLLNFINMRYIFLIYVLISALPFLLTLFLSTIISLIISFLFYLSIFFTINR